MKKDFFKEFLTNSLTEKQNLLLANSLSDEDKEALQTQVDNLTALIAKVDEMEDDEVSNEVIEDLKSAVSEMASKLEAINEKLNQKNNETEEKEEDMNKNYLESKNSLHDFAEAIRNSRNAEEFRANWQECLLKNDADNDSIVIEEGSEDAFIPAAVKGLISDIWDRNADWLKSLNYTGAKRFYCRYNTADQTAETSRAKGWKAGTKSRQDLTLAAKLLEGQFIYKIAEIDLKTKFDDDAALVTYVVNELTDQILYEIKRAILVGDGRLDNDPYKIDSIEAIVKENADAWTNVASCTSDFLVDDMRALVDGLNNPMNKEVFVFMSKADLRTLARVQASETSTPVYMSTEQVAEQIGASRIITTDLLGEDAKAVAMIPSEYYMVGAPNLLSPILYTWHEGYKNLDVYRNETVVGGGINGLKSTAVLVCE